MNCRFRWPWHTGLRMKSHCWFKSCVYHRVMITQGNNFFQQREREIVSRVCFSKKYSKNIAKILLIKESLVGHFCESLLHKYALSDCALYVISKQNLWFIKAALSECLKRCPNCLSIVGSVGDSVGRFLGRGIVVARIQSYGTISDRKGGIVVSDI